MTVDDHIALGEAVFSHNFDVTFSEIPGSGLTPGTTQYKRIKAAISDVTFGGGNIEFVTTVLKGTSVDHPVVFQFAKEFNINFLEFSDMECYTAMMNWLLTVRDQQGISSGFAVNQQGQPDVNICLEILNSGNNPVKAIKYYNCYPASVGELQFSSGAAEMRVDVTMKYTKFNIFASCEDAATDRNPQVLTDRSGGLSQLTNTNNRINL